MSGQLSWDHQGRMFRSQVHVERRRVFRLRTLEGHALVVTFTQYSVNDTLSREFSVRAVVV